MKRKVLCKRVGALILAAAMCFTGLPLDAYAASGSDVPVVYDSENEDIVNNEENDISKEDVNEELPGEISDESDLNEETFKESEKNDAYEGDENASSDDNSGEEAVGMNDALEESDTQEAADDNSDSRDEIDENSDDVSIDETEEAEIEEEVLGDGETKAAAATKKQTSTITLSADGNQNGGEYGWFWDSEDRILYLNKATIEVSGSGVYAISASCDITVDIADACSVKAEDLAVYSTGRVTVKRNTELDEVTNNNTKLDIFGSVDVNTLSIFNSGKVTVFAEDNTQPAVSADSIYLSGGVLFDVTSYTDEDIAAVYVKDGIDVLNSTEFTVWSQSGPAVTVEKGNVNINGASMKVSAFGAKGLVITEGNLVQTDGGFFYLNNNGNDEFCGIDIVNGDIELSNGAKIIAGNPEDTNLDGTAVEVENGDIILTNGAALNLYSTRDTVILDNGNISYTNCTSGSVIFSKYGYSVLLNDGMLTVNNSDIELKNGSGFDVLCSCSKLSITGGSTVWVNTTSTYATLLASYNVEEVLVSGAGTTLWLNSDENPGLNVTPNMTVTDGAVVNCSRQLSVNSDKKLNVYNGGTVNIRGLSDSSNVLLNANDDSAINIRNGGKIYLDTNKETDYYSYNTVELYNADLNILGTGSLMQIVNRSASASALYLSGESTVNVFEGTLDISGNKANIYSNTYDGCSEINLSSGGTFNLNISDKSTYPFSGKCKLNINDANLNIPRNVDYSYETINTDVTVSIENADIETPENAKLLDGHIVNADESRIFGGISVKEKGSIPYIYISKQPELMISGEIGDNLSIDVEIAKCNVTTDNEKTIKYQWYSLKKGVPEAVDGATDSVFNIPAEYGINEYYCEITAFGNVRLETKHSKAIIYPGDESAHKVRTAPLVIDDSTESQTNAEEGWSWDKDKKILSLDSVSFVTASKEYDANALTILTYPVTVNVRGNCVLSSVGGNIIELGQSGLINSETPLYKFIGNGKLNLYSESGSTGGIYSYNSFELAVETDIRTGNNDAIYVSDDLTQLIINQPLYAESGDDGIYASNSTVSINADIYVKAKNNAICSDDFNAKDCNITVSSEKNYALYVNGNFSLDNVKLDNIATDSGYIIIYQSADNSEAFEVKNNSEIILKSSLTKKCEGAIYTSSTLFSFTDSKLSVEGMMTYPIQQGYSNSDRKALIKNSTVDINTEMISSSNGFGLYFNEPVLIENCTMNVDCFGTALYFNAGVEIDKSTIKSNISSQNEGYNGVYIGYGDFVLKNNSVMEIDSSVKYTNMFICSGNLTVMESALSLSQAEDSEYSVLYAGKGLELLGTVISEPSGAYFDKTENKLLLSADKAANYVNFVRDTNKYLIPGEIEVTQGGVKIEDGVVSQDENPVLTANYTAPKGTPSDLKFRWFRVDAKTQVYKSVIETVSTTLTLSYPEVGDTRYKCVFSYGSSELERETELNIVYPNRQITYPNDGTFLHLYTDISVDNMSTHGWKWDSAERILTLDNAYFLADLNIPDDTRIVLANGKDSYFGTKVYGIYRETFDRSGSLEISGMGELIIDSTGNYAIYRFDELIIDPGVKLTIIERSNYGYAIAGRGTNNKVKVVVNHADLDVYTFGASSVFYFCDDLKLNESIITYPVDPIYHDNSYYYNDSSRKTRLNRIKIEPSDNRFEFFSKLPGTAEFMNTDVMRELETKLDIYSYPEGSTVSYEWYQVLDWTKEDPVKVSETSKYTPKNEIGEQLLFIRAIVNDGTSTYPVESDVFAAYILPKGRLYMREGLYIYSGTDSFDFMDTYGYSWDLSKKELVLDNVFIYSTDGSNPAIRVPADTTVTVSDGSVNVIRTGNCDMIKIDSYTKSGLTFTGAGKLIFENVNEEYAYTPYEFSSISPLTFNGGIDVTFCERTNAQVMMQTATDFIIDNATVNMKSGHCKNAINLYSSVGFNFLTITNGAVLNIDCYGTAINVSSSGRNVTIDEGSALNIVLKDLPSDDPTSTYYAINSRSDILINGSVNIEVEKKGAVYTDVLRVDSHGELVCIGNDEDSQTELIHVNNNLVVNGRIYAETVAPVPALYKVVYKNGTQINSGADITLINDYCDADDTDEYQMKYLSKSACYINDKVNICGSMHIKNNGGGNAFATGSSSYITFGEGVVTEPEGIKTAKPTGYYQWALTDKDSNMLSEVYIYGSEPKELKSITISGDAKAGGTIGISETDPEGATYTWQWEYSKDKDSEEYEPYYSNVKSLNLDDSFDGYYLRVRATGSGLYKGTVVSNILGPVIGTPTRIDLLTVNGKNCSFNNANEYAINVAYQTEEAEIVVTPLLEDATVKINGEAGCKATVSNLLVGKNEFTVSVTAEGETKDFKLFIYRNEPERYEIIISAEALPEGIVLEAATEDGTKSVSVNKAGRITYLTAEEGTKLKINVKGSNDSFGVWAVRHGSNHVLENLDVNASYSFTANAKENFYLDADCFYVKAPQSAKAEWIANKEAGVKVSWNLPGGSLPQALSGNYAYDYVSADCYDAESGELIATLKDSAGSSFVIFEGMDYRKGYDFEIRYGNDRNLGIIPAGLPGKLVEETGASVSVEKRPSGYEISFLDSEGRKVTYAALKLNDESESVKVFTTNLPEGTEISGDELRISDAEIADAIVNASGEIVVTAKKVGSTYITFSPVVYGFASTIQFRIDVYDDDAEEKISAPRVTKTTLNVNIYSAVTTEDSSLRIFFDGDSTDKITSAEFEDETLNKYFEFAVLDDRTIGLAANDEFDFSDKANAAEIKKIKASYKSGIVVKTIKYPEGNKTAAVTVKVTKKLPTVKAGAVKLNTFFEDATAEVILSSKQGEIESAVIDESKANACPDWLNFDEESKSVTVEGMGIKRSGNLSLLVSVKGYNTPVAVNAKVTASKTAPKVKLSSKKITVPELSSELINPIELSLASADNKVGLADMNITGVFVGKGSDLDNVPAKNREAYNAGLAFDVKDYDAENGSFTIMTNDNAGEILTAGKLMLIAFVDGNKAQRIELPVDIKVATKVTFKAPKSVTLDLAKGVGEDAAIVKITPSAAGFIPGTYDGFDTDTLKVEIKDAKGKEDRAEELDAMYDEENTALIFKSNLKTVPGSYKVTITAANNATIPVTVKTQAALPKYKLSATTVTLNKNNSADCEFITVKAGNAAFTSSVVSVTDAKGNEITDNVPVDCKPVESGEDGEEVYKVALTDKAEFGANYKVAFTYTLTDYPSVKSAKVTLTVKVPAQNKSLSKITVKTTGAIDPARPGNGLTFNEKLSCITSNSIASKRLEVYAKSGKKPATGEYIVDGKAIGVFTLKNNLISRDTESDFFDDDSFDDSLSYSGRIIYTLKNGETVESNEFKIPVKQGKIKVTQSTDKVSLCKADSADRSYVYFTIEDESVSGLRSADIFTKKGAVSNFKIKEVGNGVYALGFNGTENLSKVKSEKIKLNLCFDGCKNPSKAATVNIKVNILDIK
ncbi:MAG: hypothetical protein MJ119_03560 [Lachnospiraceae bacterium]|nr:hypothetical protein [Lachnospiraceae bacterium]